MRSWICLGAIVVLTFGAGAASAQSRDISVETMRSERRVALVIGNAAYPKDRLRNPANDARAMVETLKSLNFEVLAYEDLNEKDMRRAIDRFGERLRGSGVGLFYYSGHGIQVQGKNYLLPVDAKVERESEVEYEAVDVGRVLAKMDNVNRLNIVILDACRNNPFERAWRNVGGGLAQMVAPSGTLIAYATGPGRLASDGAGANGLYTSELLKAMRTPGLSLFDVFAQTGQAVKERTNGAQEPWIASSVYGRFAFVIDIEPLRPAKVIKGDDGAEMVLVPAGEFLMGSTDAEVKWVIEECQKGLKMSEALCKGWHERELPQHRVTLDAFYVDRYEVTNALFAAFVQATGHKTIAEREGHGFVWKSTDRGLHLVQVSGASWRSSNGIGSTMEGTHPVVQVSWHDADAYCRWSGKRLPTEAQWEKAARGVDGRRYPWGDTWNPSKANGAGGQIGPTGLIAANTKAVGSFPDGRSPYGVHDMTGNVAEWVADWMDETYYQRSPERNPTGPASGQYRVARGGDASRWPGGLRAAARDARLLPDARHHLIGFRCAKDAPK